MSDLATRGLSEVLERVNQGHPGAFNELVRIVYDDLRGIAAGRMRRVFGRSPHDMTNPPTAMANAAVMKLRQQYKPFKNSDQFFAIATRLLQNLIIDYKRQREAQKKPRSNFRKPIDRIPEPDGGPDPADQAQAIDLLERLHTENPRAAEVVTLHVLCGHDLSEVAEMLDLAESDIKSEWRFAKKWLKTQYAGR